MVNLLAFLLVISAGLNVFFLFEKKKSKLSAPKSYDARQLLHDITGGTALVKITRINPEDVLIRSPRDAAR